MYIAGRLAVSIVTEYGDRKLLLDVNIRPLTQVELHLEIK
jgi:hypothetical protein